MSYKRHELDSDEDSWTSGFLDSWNEDSDEDSWNEDGSYPGYPDLHFNGFYLHSSSRGDQIENFFFGGQTSVFICRHCSLELTDRISLSCHIIQVHRLPCCCAYCDHHFSTMEELADHLRLTHRSYENLYCKLCPFVTNTQRELWKHTWSCHKSLTERCNQCQLICFGKNTFWLHQDLCAKMNLTPFQDVRGGLADTRCLRSTWERTSACSRHTEFNQTSTSRRDPRIRKPILKSTETRVSSTKQVFSQRSETRTRKRKSENRMAEGSLKKRKLWSEGTRDGRNQIFNLKAEDGGVKAEPEAASHETRKENLLVPKIAPKKEEDTTFPNSEMDLADVLGMTNGETKCVMEKNPVSSFVSLSASASVDTQQPKLPIKQRLKQEMTCSPIGQLEVQEENAGESLSGSHYRCSLCTFSTACIQSIKKHLAAIHKVGKSTLQLFSVVQNTDKCHKNLKTTFIGSKKPATLDNSKKMVERKFRI